MTGTFWWLSFCNEHNPKGKQFLGVAIIPASEEDGMVEVVTEAYRRGCNPGGHVLGYVWVSAGSGVSVPDDFVGRLLTRAEADRLDDLLFQKYHEIAHPNPNATPRGPAQ